MSDLQEYLPVKWTYTQDKHKQNANNTRTLAPNFQVEYLLYMSTKKIKTARYSKKLDHKRLHIFKVPETTNPAARHLILPTPGKTRWACIPG